MAIGRDNKPRVVRSFDNLVQELRRALGPASGLTSEDVDVQHLTRLMEQYDSSEQGWLSYAHQDGSRGYTRNLVDNGNGKSNLVGRNPIQANKSSNAA